jgi:hypothetical protein
VKNMQLRYTANNGLALEILEWNLAGLLKTDEKCKCSIYPPDQSRSSRV